MTSFVCASLPVLRMKLISITVDAAPVFTWSAIEVSIGIIIAGLIELGPLGAKYGVKGFESFAPSKPISNDYEMSAGKL